MEESASLDMESYFSQCERERDEAANKARKNIIFNMLAAVMAMMVILCLTKEVCNLIKLFDQYWIHFIYGIEGFLCAAVIIHLFCERHRIKTEPLVKTQDTENAHHDSEEIKSIIKQTHALKNHHTFWFAFLLSIIISCLWIETAILFYKADSKKEIRYAWALLFSLLLPTNVYFKDIFIPMIICPFIEFMDPSLTSDSK
ncbi:hypothetical protein GCK72_019446 [Caenorhabditis remanei]|uniref:Transmembrane protein n=1 Tax=Caenorhabditis remanei TaxID=31234 RepID=A0A6A5GDX6_CAERE|nr:hypothetical protein GCK72_019446 [Caenorhabditis remanei]KAF1752891.1 hypothetical protein GCK72_019446 [Caenorhabditis remanei]